MQQITQKAIAKQHSKSFFPPLPITQLKDKKESKSLISCPACSADQQQTISIIMHGRHCCFITMLHILHVTKSSLWNWITKSFHANKHLISGLSFNNANKCYHLLSCWQKFSLKPKTVLLWTEWRDLLVSFDLLFLKCLNSMEICKFLSMAPPKFSGCLPVLSPLLLACEDVADVSFCSCILDAGHDPCFHVFTTPWGHTRCPGNRQTKAFTDVRLWCFYHLHGHTHTQVHRYLTV